MAGVKNNTARLTDYEAPHGHGAVLKAFVDVLDVLFIATE
jgi:hypothetical protein